MHQVRHTQIHPSTVYVPYRAQATYTNMTKRYSSAGGCWISIPNCGWHLQPATEQHARTASWMRTDRATGSNKGTSESPKKKVTLHIRVLPERALIYAQSSEFIEKTTHQKTQPPGCHQQNVLMLHQTGRRGSHCFANNCTKPPSNFFPFANPITCRRSRSLLGIS
jgi:hypothetical protein